jgi:hypothetical protein
MKLLALKLFILVTAYLAGLAMCSEAPIKADSSAMVIVPVSDSVAMIPPGNCDSIVIALQEETDRNNRLIKRIDSLNTALFKNKYKVERVKYYLAIVNRKPSQAKFLRGWIIRAVK